MKPSIVIAIALAYLVMTMAPSAHAEVIDVTGTASGAVGGQSFTASITGSLGDNGQDIAIVNFDPLPSDLDSPAIAGLIITFWCPINPKDSTGLPDFQTIFDVTGGNYDLNRTWTFEGFPGDQLTVSAIAATSGLNLSVIGTLNGSAPMSGGSSILSYNQILTPNGSGSILESGTARFSSGLIAHWTGEYVYSGSALATGYVTNLNWDLLNLSGSTLNAAWTAQAVRRAVPEPNSVMLLGMGLLILFGLRWRDRRGKTKFARGAPHGEGWSSLNGNCSGPAFGGPLNSSAGIEI